MKIFGREFDPRDMVATIIFGGSMGSGAFLIYELVAREPRMIIDTFRSWGPLSVLALVMLAMLDRGFRAVVGATEKSAAALQEMSDAVRQIAKKDSDDAYEQRILMGHIATQMETILARFEQMKEELAEVRKAGTGVRT